MQIFSYKEISKEKYSQNKPFPHVVLSNEWNNELLSQCNKDIYKITAWDSEKKFYGAMKKKVLANHENFSDSIKKIIFESQSMKFLEWLKSFTGEEVLLPDPYMLGGGVHSISEGGFAKIHTDFNWHKKLKLHRKLNILIYLNDKWDESWGGHLELWSKDMKKCELMIPPLINKTVIFHTDDDSPHGHPEPLNCPNNVLRNSIALYYYSPIKSKKVYYKRDDTKYKEREIDNFDKGSIRDRIYKVLTAKSNDNVIIRIYKILRAKIF
ncbi:2OG-Fe(II) oxygenase [Candidatus Pelagibacter sp.]|nr:2OG-Fe(II) oxygenase [Candidatus Pelagibacter sp.]